MKEKLKSLKAKGMVLTIQRMAVLESLTNSRLHLTAEEIYRQLKVRYPSLSLATVYTTLEVLKKAELIQELNLLKGVSCYDLELSAHHHFYCQVCKRLLNLKVSCPVAECGQFNGNRVKSVQACFYGVCAECIKKEKED